MRLNLILPNVEPNEFEYPKKCPRDTVCAPATGEREDCGCAVPESNSLAMRMYLRYANARKPGRGKKHEVAYRMRNLFMDRWNLWPRLTFYRTWKDKYGNEILDGSNNHCERAIGWWIKERYRSMRGYKQGRSAPGMSRLIAFAGNNLSRGLNLADLMA